jgi:hypothetical protein
MHEEKSLRNLFPRIWGPLFHPEKPRFQIMNLGMFLNSALTGLIYLVDFRKHIVM